MKVSKNLSRIRNIDTHLLRGIISLQVYETNN